MNVRTLPRRYVDIIVVLAQKDFKLRYRNSILGFLWSLLNPLAYMVILTVVFSLLLRVSVSNYPVYLLVGILIWRFFSIGTAQSLQSIVGNPSLVTKMYLPRYLIVLANNLANLLGAGLEFLALLPIILLLGVSLGPLLMLLPIVLILEFLLIFGISLGLSSLNLKYRDFHQLWDIALQLGFFLSPVVYDQNLIPPRYGFVYSLNPMTKLIEFARDILIVGRTPSLLDIGIIFLGIAVFLSAGLLIFGRLEAKFAEEL